MAYDDPIGDEHKQSQLLPAGIENTSISKQFSDKFGAGNTIKHSDFRVSHIIGVRITKLSDPDFEDFVDRYHDAEVDQQSISKHAFGELKWFEYVHNRELHNTLEERELKFKNTQLITTWETPVRSRPYLANEFPPLVDVDLYYGETIEFEVVFGDMGDKYKSYRRYDHTLFDWTVAGQDASDWHSLYTSRGMKHNKFGFQSRYTLNKTSPSSSSLMVSFTPKDSFNDHDNMASQHHNVYLMSPGPTWPVFCMLHPKPIDTTDMNLSLDITTPSGQVENNQLCTSTGDTVDVRANFTLTGVPDDLMGEDPQINLSKNTADTTLTASLTSTDQITDQLTAPSAGSSETHVFSGSAMMTDIVYRHTYKPAANGTPSRVDRTPLFTTTYTLTASDDQLTLTSVPAIDSIKFIKPWPPTQVQNTLNSVLYWNTLVSSSVANKSIAELQPSIVAGPGLIGRLRRPSMLINASDNPWPGDSTKTHKQVSRWFNMFMKLPVQGVDTEIQWYNSDQQDWITIQTDDDFPEGILYANVVSDHITSDAIPFYLAGTPSDMNTTSWRMQNTTSGSTCAAVSQSIDVVTVSDLPEKLSNGDQTITYNNGINVQLRWDDTSNHVVTLSGPAGEVQYQLQRLFRAELRNTTTNTIQSLGEVTVSDNQLLLSDISNPGLVNLLVDKNNNGVKQTYQLRVQQLWQSTDMFDQDDVKTWSGEFITFDEFSVLDCSDPDLRDASSGQQIADDTLITGVSLQDYSRVSNTIAWQGRNEVLNPYGCRDYLTQITYTHVSGSFTYDQAVADAESRGGTLAYFKTPEQLNAFNAYVDGLTGYGNGWIGITDVESEDEWRWIDGTIATDNCMNWSSSNPNNESSLEHYGEIQESQDGKFNDQSGNVSQGYFMQTTSTKREIATTFESTPPSSASYYMWRHDDLPRRVLVAGRTSLLQGVDSGHAHPNGNGLSEGAHDPDYISWVQSDGVWLTVITATQDNQQFEIYHGQGRVHWQKATSTPSGDLSSANGWSSLSSGNNNHINIHGTYYTIGQTSKWDGTARGAGNVISTGASFGPLNTGEKIYLTFEDVGGAGNVHIWTQWPSSQPCGLPRDVQVADITCQVQSGMELEFSGMIADQQNITLTNSTMFNSWTSDRSNAATSMYVNMIDDDGGKIYNNQLSVNLTPVLNTTTKPKTLLSYDLRLDMDHDDTRARGNRGDVELTRRDNGIVGVLIKDIGGVEISGKPHSSVGANTKTDRYKFKIYATVIDNE